MLQRYDNEQPIMDINKSLPYINEKEYSNNLNNLIAGSSLGSGAEWWDLDWSYRVDINITTQYNYTNKLIELPINFTNYLKNINENGELDINSIRLIEYNYNGSILSEIPSQFVPNPESYNASTNAYGNLYFVLNGTNMEGKVRYFFIYFDILEHGSKQSPNYSTGLLLKTNIANKDYTMENNYIRISMAEGAPPNGGSYYDHIYEVYNKLTARDQQRSATHWGWMLYYWSYGGYASTFDGVTTLEVVADGSVVTIVKMIFDYTNFKYERYYYMNYLDNSILIRHWIKAKTTISQGVWYFASWWNPGRGDNNYLNPNSAYGLGGFTFSNPHPILGPEFTSVDELYPTDFNGWKQATQNIKDNAWFVQYDEDKKEGVGTIWTPTNYLYYVGYRYNVNEEGRNLYFYITPPALSPNSTWEFNMTGIVYNGYDGDYVKNRSKGIQNYPQIQIGNMQNSGKLIKLKIVDIDGLPVENVRVELWNSSNIKIDEKFTDTTGNCTFYQLYNDTFKALGFYNINGIEYEILNTNIPIDLPIQERYVYSIKSANLTTAEFYAKDSAISDPNYAMLVNANLTISNHTTGENITWALTGLNGWAKFRIPSTDYNISVAYMGTVRQFTMNISGAPVYTTQEFTINSHLYIELSVIVSENKTSLSVNFTEYSKSGDGWPHSENFNITPYYISMYRGDSVNITVYYQNTKGTLFGIKEADQKTWKLMNEQNYEIDSGELVEHEGENGNYSLIIDTNKENYIAGTYVLFVNLKKSGYQDGILYIGIIVQNHTSILSLNNSESILVVYWNENLNITVDYKTVLPVTQNIEGADLSYMMETNHNINGTLNEIAPGKYSVQINSSNFEVGQYNFIIYAYKENITAQTIYVQVNIYAIETNSSWVFYPDFGVSKYYMKVALGETIKFNITYQESVNNKYIPNSTVSINFYMDEANNDIYEPRDLGDGNYNIEFYSGKYHTGIATVTVSAYEPHHKLQRFEFNIEILDYWNTQIELVEPPSFYPWGNNASFIFKYFCNEQPRYGRMLNGATINQLNISIKRGEIYEPQLLLTSLDLGSKWGYEDLNNDPLYGAGYYRIWFLTNILNLTQTTAFYAEPNISVQYYRPAQFSPYVWIRPPLTKLTVYTVASKFFSFGVIEKVNIYLNENVMFNIIYNVSDIMADLNGQLISGANLTYEIYNYTNPSDILMQGVIDNEISTGNYSVTIPAIKLGEYKIKFKAELENYTTAITYVEFNVLKRPIAYNLDKDTLDLVITTPQNKDKVISITLTDKLNQLSLSDATISFILGDNIYKFIENPNVSGLYTFTFNKGILEQFDAETSHQITIIIQKENYTEVSISLTLQIQLPVDPYLGIPYRYWIIMGITIIIVITSLIIYNRIQIARIPEFIRKCNATINSIMKKKKISKEPVTISKRDYIIKTLGPDWELIYLNIKDSLPTNLIEKEESTELGGRD